MKSAVQISEVARKQAEADFHDQREEVRESTSQEDFEKQYPNQRFYKITGHSRDYVDNWFLKNCPGKEVLDYCSGNGELSIKLAKMGAFATGIDVSELGVLSARNQAKELGLSSNAQFYKMDAESLEFEDSSFDFAVCCGVLHHLDLNKAYKELARVIKPGGKIICIEALAHNPIIHYYRKSTPELRTEWEVQHILRVQDIKMGGKYFGKVEIKFFHLATLLAIPFIGKPLFKPVLQVTRLLDEVLTKVPFLRTWAWQAVFVLTKKS